MFTKKEALKLWENEFGDKDYGYDFSGKKIKKLDYLQTNQVGWLITYIKPLEAGGTDNMGNLAIMHHKTSIEKGSDYPDFSINEIKYTIKHDEKGDYYYIEKVDVTDDGSFI